MKRLVAALLSAGLLALFGGTASALAASISISASPSTNTGDPVTLTIHGHADQNGSYDVKLQGASVSCGSTAGRENTGDGGAALGRSIANRENLAAGEDFHDTASFTPTAGRSYRLCAYLGDYNQNGDAAPDAFDQLVLSPSGGTTGGGDNTVEFTDANGGCANYRRFTRIDVLHVDCADAQNMERGWAAKSSCRPTARHRSRRCTVLGFSCHGVRPRHRGYTNVRCTRRSQRVSFRYRP
jgi:hypothetical protein